jgi:formamidopyrimidine-DNA glycosylase
MPEWPEMEHYRKQLGNLVCGPYIADVAVHRPRSINKPPEAFADALRGRRILFVERRGKHLLFHLDDGFRLLLHLMLDGYLYHGTEGLKPDSRYQVIIQFVNGNRLFFGGLRLGYLHHLPAKTAMETLRELGPEPFDPHLDEQGFARLFQNRRGALKPVLTDQRVIAGIGNCYADEICHEARVSPLAKVPSLKEDDWSRLFHAMRRVLKEAEEAGGYMDKPLFAGDSRTGGYNERMRVYEREGERCPRCGGTVRRETVSSKSTYFCPVCQPVD